MDKKELMQATAEALRIANARKRKTYEEIALDSGLSLSTVSRLFRGARVIDVEQIHGIALALDLHPAYLSEQIFSLLLERNGESNAPEHRTYPGSQVINATKTTRKSTQTIQTAAMRAEDMLGL
ncbi:helix-turn-helix transcriptional regulator [Lysinibacter sp. HNR]|uniref:helix-turn-helix domain-containing protein n=1 Tax=Lysinibacter sp. HNR TaxID=3031408 RepID=UPI002434998C|nr:helix-turn-helix transcriptional regulator [Lysinibacter sp. HNR]WGD38509.1 helix-turn-helix transcriptional regulator [Lysinibacter sp. HNR]